jgi:hypothetical protein
MKITMPTPEQLKAMSDKELLEKLDRALKVTEAGLRLAAVYWMELSSRGATAGTGITVPWSAYLPAVAAGRLDPRMILAYGWSPGMLDIVADLVPEDQAKIANPREPIPLVVPDADGGLKTIMRSPELMKASELRQVFGDGRIRTPDEQRPHVAMPPVRPAAKPEGGPGKAPGEVKASNADLDLFNALTPVQREQVRRYAATRHPPVTFVDLVVRWAVQRGACKETPAPSRGRRSGAANGREAHPE